MGVPAGHTSPQTLAEPIWFQLHLPHFPQLPELQGSPAQATVKAICNLHGYKCFHMVSSTGMDYQAAEHMAVQWLVAGINKTKDEHQDARQGALFQFIHPSPGSNLLATGICSLLCQLELEEHDPLNSHSKCQASSPPRSPELHELHELHRLLNKMLLTLPQAYPAATAASCCLMPAVLCPFLHVPT